MHYDYSDSVFHCTFGTANVLKVTIQLELSTGRQNLQSAIPWQSRVYSCFCQSVSEDNFGLCPAPPNVPLRSQRPGQWPVESWPMGWKDWPGNHPMGVRQDTDHSPFPLLFATAGGEGGNLHVCIEVFDSDQTLDLGLLASSSRCTKNKISQFKHS